MDAQNKIVVLIDMDCFYCQVEENLNPELKGKPIAVVQYNPWKGGGIIAVNYVAKAQGVTRHMRGDEAKEKCPEIQLPSVPCQRGKADISKYRNAGKKVAEVLQKFTPLMERASIDEAYLDITIQVEERLKIINSETINAEMMPNTFILGYQSINEFISDIQNYGQDCIDFDYEHTKRLLVGAVIVSEIRATVFQETGYQCSAGISHNKILAKLVCGMNKPNKQTVVPKHSVNILYKTLPLKKVKHLGGKFGDLVSNTLKIKVMAELQRFTEKELQSKFDDRNGTWLYNIARGVDTEPVQARFNPKSIGCCKQFRGKSALTNLDSLRKWLKDLGDEINDRLEKDSLENNRTPKQMVVSFSSQMQDGRDISSSRSYNFAAEDELCGDFFSIKALEIVLDCTRTMNSSDEEINPKLKAPIKFLGISLGKFEDHDSKKTKNIKDYFSINHSKGHCSSMEMLEPKLNAESFDQNDKTKDRIGRPHQDVSKSDNNAVEKRDSGIQSSFTLDKQESFFAKFLQKDEDKEIADLRTPACTIVTCGDESNDTNYSGSTIDEEINKSIALFEEDREEVDRISSIRNLLQMSKDNFEGTEQNQAEVLSKSKIDENAMKVKCSDCGKLIPESMTVIHADYHLALSIRNEERQQLHKEKKNNIDLADKSKTIQNEKKESKTNNSIKSFLVKLNDTVPSEMCSECGKRVQLDSYLEHLDFHEAQRLNKELNRPTQTNNSGAKRKRNSDSSEKKPKVMCKTIDLFFR
ncbi:unnamed protein product [Leptosia nina]|uniref:DNA polymerase eta n=1 Tax=Leptosia nina TaxID=320188 RepID=A0AAV1JSY7_9NEOP